MAGKMKHWQDESGRLGKVFGAIIRKEFPILQAAKIIYTFRNNERLDEEGRAINASARKIGAKERDIYGFDFEINVHYETWKNLDKEGRKRLAWHELRHCRVETQPIDDGSEEPVYDDDGNLKTAVENHDLVFKGFKEEILRFGLREGEIAIADFFAKELRAHKKSQKDDDAPESEVKKSKVKKGKKTSFKKKKG